MPIPKSKEDRVQDAFLEHPNDPGETAYRVYDPTLENLNITVSPGGLNNRGRITFVTVNPTTWVAAPASALSNRNAISIKNPLDYPAPGQDTIIYSYVNDDTEDAKEIPVGGDVFLDITDSILIYLKSLSGTFEVVIEELS